MKWMDKLKSLLLIFQFLRAKSDGKLCGECVWSQSHNAWIMRDEQGNPSVSERNPDVLMCWNPHCASDGGKLRECRNARQRPCGVEGKYFKPKA